MACAAKDLGLDGHLLALGEAADPIAQGNHLTRDLMALGDGIGGKGMGAVVDMDVTAADADISYFYQYLPRPGSGRGTC